MKKTAENTALMDRYHAALNTMWGTDTGMVKYCLGTVQEIAALKNGMYFILEKQPIEKDFCFGYSTSFYSDEEEKAAWKMAAKAQNDESYFIRKNLEHFNRLLDALDDSMTFSVLCRHYDTKKPGLNSLRELSFRRIVEILNDFNGQANLEEIKGTEVPGRYYIMTDEDKEVARAAIKRAMEQHEKKVRTYLKRYGLSKVNAWTYWRDE